MASTISCYQLCSHFNRGFCSHLCSHFDGRNYAAKNTNLRRKVNTNIDRSFNIRFNLENRRC